MNKRICFGVMIAIFFLALVAININPVPVDASIEDAHSEHAHASLERGNSIHAAKELDALIADDDRDDHAERDDHAGHGHQDAGDGLCPEHRVMEKNDALCQGSHLAELQAGEGMLVRLATPDVAAKAGVALVQPKVRAHFSGTDIPGRVKFNRDKLAMMTPLSPGIVQAVAVRPGDLVARGDVLARVATPEIASLKAQFTAANARYLQTEATLQQEEELFSRGISSRRELQQARSEFKTAQSNRNQYRQQLLNYGLAEQNLESMLRGNANSNVLEILAPFSGTIVEVNTAIGEAVDSGKPLFTVAELSTLWVELSVPESRIYEIRVGMPIQATFKGIPDQLFEGRIFQVGARLDERSRTLKVLAEVDNAQHALKVGMFGNVRLLEKAGSSALTVPVAAVHTIDGATFVFIQDEPDLFELRRVRVGAHNDGNAMILAGLSQHERIVTRQGFALKSEVLKARLGASCADH
ncbi:MAG: efflux RND transporter periplasmic adaptor subunit [Desulfuromonadales bacterium]|nr:efflux RND transporter periplasmic adaptor subunit [Desulfuromonadales bacterium]